MSTYVYGIAADSHPSLPEGRRGVGDPARPVRILKEAGLAAIVSDAPEGLRPQRNDLLAHQDVVAEACVGGTILPMRFGSVAPDDAAVTAVLAMRVEHYEERLAALAHKVEYNVQAGHNGKAVPHRVRAENPEIRSVTEAKRQGDGGRHEQRVRLGEMVAAELRSRETKDAVDLRHTLEPVADSVRVGHESTGWPANMSFLVDRESAEVFLAAVEQFRTRHPHLDLRVNGPLPPYGFVEPGPSEPAEPTGH